MDSITKAQAIGLSCGASLITFSYALSTRPDSIQTRCAAVCLLAALQYSLVVAITNISEHGELIYGAVAVMATCFWHAVDYLLVSRASSRDFVIRRGRTPSIFRQYIWTPLGLLANWRRINTPWQISKIPPFSHRQPAKVPSRLSLIVKRLFYMILSFIVIDLCCVSTIQSDGIMDQRAILSRLDQVTLDELKFRLGLLVRYLLSAVSGVYLPYAAFTVVALVLGLSSPSDCPPMFGPLWKTYTVAIFWGDFFHQGLRRAIGGPADAVVHRVLRVPRGTCIARSVKTLLAFALSGVIHGCAEASTGLPPSERSHFFFFTSQAFAILFEEVVISLYRRAGKPLPTVVERLVGYAWVVCWFFWVAPNYAYSAVKYAHPEPSQIAPLLAKLAGTKA